jgi:hypothetical protein
MKHTSMSLARRDPALAAAMGIIGSDFGAEFGDDYGAEFGDELGAEFGDDDMGDDWGAEFGGPAVARPTKTAALAAWKARRAQMVNQARRSRLLEPNKGSALKVERYAFSISQAITIGTPVALNVTGQPDTTIRPQQVTMNAPVPMFAFVAELKVANVSVTVGGGVEDAYNYSALSVGRTLDMPTLSPANRATMLGNYTGLVPPGLVAAFATTFSVNFKGPASIVA